jgi:hypothetical protein
MMVRPRAHGNPRPLGSPIFTPIWGVSTKKRRRDASLLRRVMAKLKFLEPRPPLQPVRRRRYVVGEREFLPCQELKETISRIMLSLAACGGVRAVPSADKHGNSATIPLPAPAGRIGQPRMDRKLKDGKRDKMAFLKLHARRNINPSHKKKQLFGAGGASKERGGRHAGVPRSFPELQKRFVRRARRATVTC